jgi:DNA (cytosine-5)-methyltransferase 1
MTIKGLSLFSGAGGFDLGATQAGVNVRGCIEIDRFAVETLRANFESDSNGPFIHHGSIEDVDLEAFSKQSGIYPGELDVLFGGPPCQTFSQIGKQASLDDPRGLLLFQMVRFAEFFMPKTVVIENVKGLLSATGPAGRKGEVLESLVSSLENLGFNVNWKVLDSSNYGVAQNRHRLFIVGALDFEPTFPQPTHSEPDLLNPDAIPKLSVGEVLIGLGSPEIKGSEREDSHIDGTPAGDRRRISGVPEGSFLAACEFLPQEQRGKLTKKDSTKFRRLSNSGRSNTLRCGEIFFHPNEDRYLTPREYLRVHGYPDEFVLKGPIRGRSGQAKELDQHRLVANSVAPPVASELLRHLIAELRAAVKGSGVSVGQA